MRIPYFGNASKNNHIPYETKLRLIKRMQDLSAYIESKYGNKRAENYTQQNAALTIFAKKIA